ncbi:hemolysin XhlA family protein [Virgibacillus salexigens]|uniref:Protein XhlA n=1 Tax=Virgibacillus kapii TaxID=1638645 RepID=A0ABQ2DQ34_9BACI|nr:hemolysin XhlA family protein [Virgibacillus kapii]GGJ62097.1 protein XhlA [Virgibacillus kapii]
MSEQEEMDTVDKTQQDIIEIRQDIKNMKGDINKLQLNDIKQDEKIVNLQTTLSSIQDDTKWIRRMITKAIVTAVITGVIGGAIALFFAKF